MQRLPITPLPFTSESMMIAPRFLRLPLVMAALMGTVPAALAHPHIFVDTALVLRIDDQNQLLGVELVWAYDEYYSLVVLEDRGLDPDFDGHLTPQEQQELRGFDLSWATAQKGHTFVTRGDRQIPLGAPEHLSTDLRFDRIITHHFRPLEQPIPADDLTLQIYDPTYYTAYTVGLRVSLPPDGACTASVTAANLDQAYTFVEETLYGMSTAEAEDNFPQIGQSFADTIRISCAHGS